MLQNKIRALFKYADNEVADRPLHLGRDLLRNPLCFFSQIFINIITMI